MRLRSATLPTAAAAVGLALVASGSAVLAGSASAGPAAPHAQVATQQVAKGRSYTITVSVSRTRVKVGQKFVIKGKVRPKASGKVALQRKRGGVWKVVDRDKLSKKSRYRFVQRAKKAGATMRFRVVKTSGGKHASRSKVVRSLRRGRPAGDAGSGGATLSARAEAVLRLTNELRASGVSCGGTWMRPTNPLKANARLMQAAQDHAQDMVDRDYFDHTSRNGDGPWERAQRAGYQGSRIGENIAMGYPTPKAVVDGWVRSEGHCRNLMNPKYDHIGIGVVGSGSPTWVQVFGG